jgi:hypothetical protein
LPAIIIGGTTVAGSSIWPLGLPIAGRRVLELGARYRRPHWLLCRSRLRGDRVSQLIEAVGLAFAITALITFGLANITPSWPSVTAFPGATFAVSLASPS